jgi:protein TonB
VAAKPAIGNVAACAPKNEDYPAAAVRAEATGTTRVRFTVDATGKLSNAEVVKPAGSSREHRQLDRVALAKLSECTFRPGNDETGKPVGGTFEVEYVWKLE